MCFHPKMVSSHDMFVAAMKNNIFRKFDYILIITHDYYWFFYTQNL
jgi:hypothetical protein